MFQSFTGNSRRPRQVNLSRRNNDPFASVRTGGVGKPPGGGGNAIEDAQQARKARQLERDRLNASRTIQKTWRGYSQRRLLRTRRRPLLDESEAHLRSKDNSDRTLEEIRSHLRLCTYTVTPMFGDEWAAERILYAGQWVYERAVDISKSMKDDGSQSSWAALLRSFSQLLSQSVELMLFPRQHEWAQRLDIAVGSGEASTAAFAKIVLEMEAAYPNLKDRTQRLFLLFASVVTILDSWQHIDWSHLKVKSMLGRSTISTPYLLKTYYTFVARLSKLQWLPNIPHEQYSLSQRLSEASQRYCVSDPLVSIVAAAAFSLGGDRPTAQRDVIYESIIIGLMTSPELHEDILLALRSVLTSSPFYQQARKIVKDPRGQLGLIQYQRLLANTVHMSNLQRGTVDTDTASTAMTSHNAEFLSFVSLVLSFFTTVEEMEDSTLAQLRVLTGVDTIAELFRRSYLLTDTSGSKEADADILSDYILNILRLLPQQAEEIRMRLYISHEYQRTDAKAPQKTAVRYFWDAASATSLFKRAVKGWTDVRRLLSDASDARRREWKVVILFIEIYAIARIQDDEQFVRGLNNNDLSQPTNSSTLTGIEIQMLLEFLKNVCYCLYLKVPSEPSGQPRATQEEPASLPASAIGINMQQLKDSVTALLRMLYERDSRRKFLPEGSFLMLIDEKESQNFVSSVIRETLLKQKLDEEDSAEENDPEEEELEAPGGDRDRSRGVIRSQHIQRIERHSQLQRQQRILAKRRAQEEAAPRVELLENVPFLIPFETRVQLFRMHVEDDMCERRGGDPDPERWRLQMHMSGNSQLHSRLAAHQAELNRESIFEDAFNAFDKLGEGLKEPIRISFIGEEGIDGGGVTKEFLTSVINDVFRVDSPYRLFTESDVHMLYPNPNILEETDAELDEFMALGEEVTEQQRHERRKRILEYYRFAGRLVGKCLYEGILVDIPLARFFVAKWASTGGFGAARNETTYRPGLNDMWDYDKAIFRSLLNLQNSKEDVSTWGITFAVDENIAGKQVEHELIKPGGADMLVNNSNRLVYIFRLVNHYLMVRQGRQTRAFLDGLGSIIKPTWLRMFNEAEIRVLLGGESRPIDVEDLRRNTVCSGIYAIGDDAIEHDTVRMFWEVMHEMEDSDRRKLLQYVTSTPNAPLMGFAHLNPRFSIRDSSSDQGRLPTSSTCANLLKLPMYRSKATLRDRIMTAIYSGAGFDLS